MGQPSFSDDPEPLSNLNGFRPLPPEWGFDWRFFFELDEDRPPQRALKIDTRLALPLGMLPGVTEQRSLAHRNLLRGYRLGLPAGQYVARAMGIDPLSDEQLGLIELSTQFVDRAPLWFYILREAEVLCAGERLGPVGGRIVGEVLIGLLYEDRLSYLRVEPNWSPVLPQQGDEFQMADLIRFAGAA